MRKILMAATAVLLATSAANAYCVSAPDDADTHYVGNATAHTLCLQEDLSDTTDEMAEAARWQAQLNDIRATLLQQQRQQMQQFQTFDPFPLN